MFEGVTKKRRRNEKIERAPFRAINDFCIGSSRERRAEEMDQDSGTKDLQKEEEKDEDNKY